MPRVPAVNENNREGFDGVTGGSYSSSIETRLDSYVSTLEYLFFLIKSLDSISIGVFWYLIALRAIDFF